MVCNKSRITVFYLPCWQNYFATVYATAEIWIRTRTDNCHLQGLWPALNMNHSTRQQHVTDNCVGTSLDVAHCSKSPNGCNFWGLFTQLQPNNNTKYISAITSPYGEGLERPTWKQHIRFGMWCRCELESGFRKLFILRSIRNLSGEPNPSRPNPTKYYSACLHGGFQIKRGWLLNVVFRDEMAFGVGGWGIGMGGFVCLGLVIHTERAATEKEGEVMEGSNPDDVISSRGTALDNSHAKAAAGWRENWVTEKERRKIGKKKWRNVLLVLWLKDWWLKLNTMYMTIF